MHWKNLIAEKGAAQAGSGANKINLALVGFKGCGKSTVGAALARMLKTTFIDLDRRIEENHEDERGESLSCRDIFRRHGEAYFRAIERKTLQQVLSSPGGAVVALGGGSVEHNKELLTKGAKLAVVFIYARPKIIFSRILAKGIPPFFDKNDTMGSFKKLYRKRLKAYKEVAHFTVDNSSRPCGEVASEIIALIKGKGFGD